jgi:diguanylate cyclase (GGDEF)-like protein
MMEKHFELIPVSREEFYSLEIFRKVSFESMVGYLMGCPVVHAEAEKVLLSPNCEQHSLLLLLDGLLEIRMDGADGMPVSDLPPGSSAGEIAIFDNSASNIWIVAKEPSRVLVIGAPIAIAMFNASHDLCLNMLHILSRRILDNNEIAYADKHHIRCIEEYARVDTLTSLHNRRWLEEMYTRELQRSHTDALSLAAFMIDIDYFKRVNDTYGHLAGDTVLIAIAKALVRCLRSIDMPVRFGGEEFSVFLPNTNTESAYAIAERIRRAIHEMSVPLSNGEFVSVTVSIGVALLEAEDTVESLLRKADRALYQAKNAGRNQVCFYNA